MKVKYPILTFLEVVVGIVLEASPGLGGVG